MVAAVIGGEGNGGVIHPELHYGRDALVGTFLTLPKAARRAPTATYPAYHISKNKIELTLDIDVNKVLAQMKAKYAGEQVIDIDGVKIDFADGAPAPNTEPIIRIYEKPRQGSDASPKRSMANPCNQPSNKPPVSFNEGFCPGEACFNQTINYI